MKLTAPQQNVLELYVSGERKNSLQLKVDPRVVWNLRTKGLLRECNWSKVKSEIDMRITPFGLETFKKSK